MGKNKKKILFRADGNSTSGLGHLYRLFALVEMLRSDFEIVFLTSESSTQSVIPPDYHLKTIPASVTLQSEPEWINKVFNAAKTIIIADGYGFDSNYQRRLVDFEFKLIYIDDLVSEQMFADIVVNHAIGISSEQYKSKTTTQFGLGTEYAILRPEFLTATKNIREIGTITDVFVCFGGSDSLNLTERTVEVLLTFEQVQHIHIVLGGAYKYAENGLLKTPNSKIKIHHNLSAERLVDVMLECQLAIVPSSTILYEVSAVQIPTLSGYYVDNQKGIYNGFIQKGAILGLGDFNKLTKKRLADEMSKALTKDRAFLNHQMAQQRLLFDDLIVQRYKKMIKSLC